MSSESETPIGPEYVLNGNNSEVSRLKTQYFHFKTVFGPDTVPPVVNTTRINKVIDVATGTGAWALDLLSQPDVRNCDLQVFACDISTSKFPRAYEPDVDKIIFFQHDVTKPFPDEMLGTFDLVNMNYLVFALTVQGWKLALQNMRDLLKPGGHLILRDSDIVGFTHENPPPPEGQGPESDFAAHTQGESTLATVNRIVLDWALRQGLVVGLSYHFRKMLQDASLQVLSSTRALAPYGEYCGSHKGLNGTSFSEFTESSSQSFSQILNAMTSAMMKAGCLELGDGTRIADEEGRKALMKELRDFVVEGGIFYTLSEWVAVRPLES